MTVVQLIEMKATERTPSAVPGEVGARLAGRKLYGLDHPGVSNQMMHWGHGTLMGAVRGLLAIPIASWALATAVFFALLWVGDVVIYRVLHVANWPWRWEADSLARDIGFKLLYVVATSAAFALLTASFT
ncbi:MAG TPA: hypothetical protein VGV93_07280 [Acidimicrobiales bacterium]|nr:hypothetical protein [Acidimicrobiales bacterium]